MKKILSILVAAIMVMSLAVTAFAATASIATEDAKTVQAEVSSISFKLPDGLTLETGDVVTVHIKGTATNEKVRIYFTDGTDNARVCDVVVIETTDGAFDTTVDIAIDTTGAVQGTQAPTVLLLKGPSYGVKLTDVSVEVLEITSDKVVEAAEETPADDTAEVDTTPVDDTTDTAEETTPAETGIALAIVPMVVAAAAVVASKRR